MNNPFIDKIWLNNYPSRIPYSIDYPNKPLFYFLEETAKKHPNHPAIVFFGKEMTYAEIDELSDRFAYYLKNNGINKGDIISILLPNTPQYVIAFWGILKVGAVINPLNPLYTEREITEMVDDAQSKMVIVLDALSFKLKGVFNKVDKVIITSIADFFPVPLKIGYTLKTIFKPVKVEKSSKIVKFSETIISEGKFKEQGINPKEDLAVLQYTGGTTGKPKGVMLTHMNLVANTMQLKYWFPMQETKEVFVGLVPFFHIGGVTAALTFGTLWAAKLVILPRFHTKPTLETITKYKVTFFMGVASIYIALDNVIKENKDKYSIDSIKLLGVGMAPCPQDLMELYKKDYGKDLLEGYGLTENAGVTFQQLVENGPKIGSIGIPFPNTDAKIVNLETGELVGVNESGELCIKGPHIAKGYLNRPDANERAFKDGWLYTGDMARIDEKGFFYILGRKDDVINVKGFQVYPREIENILEETGEVAEAAVIGIPDPYAIQKVIAFVIPQVGHEVNKEKLINLCKEKLVAYKVPSEIIIENELPRSPIGKILKYALRDQAINNKKST